MHESHGLSSGCRSGRWTDESRERYSGWAGSEPDEVCDFVRCSGGLRPPLQFKLIQFEQLLSETLDLICY